MAAKHRVRTKKAVKIHTLKCVNFLHETFMGGRHHQKYGERQQE